MSVVKNQKAFDLFRKAAEFKQCRYPVEFSPGWGEKLPHLSKAKWAAQLMTLRVLWACGNGKADDAGETLLTLITLDHSLEQEPIFISQMVRYAITEYLRKGIEQSLNRVLFRVTVIEQLAKELARMEGAKAGEQGYSFSAEVLANIHGGLFREVRALARLRLLQTAFAMERNRAAHMNLYPALLSDPKYMDSIPLDPMDAKRMKYKRVGKGYVLESAGVSAAVRRDASENTRTNAVKEATFTVVNPPKYVPGNP